MLSAHRASVLPAAGDGKMTCGVCVEPVSYTHLDVYKRQILTIHQSIPINGIASLTLSVDVLPETGDVTQMVARIEEQTGIHYVKILGRE